jgi:chitinase
VGCGPGEVALASKDHYVDPKTGKDEVCSLGGTAYYCCKAEQTGDNLCQWAGKCVELDKTPRDTPKSEVCPSGSRTITYRKGGCGVSWDQNSWEPFCCSEKVKDPKCYWEAKSGWEGIAFNTCGWNCEESEIDLGYHDWGGGESCPAYWSDGESTYSVDGARKLCCDRNALSVKIRTVPVDITHLWENVGDRVDKDKQTWALSVDDNKLLFETDFSLNPDEHAFGWHIFSGPEDKVTTLDKRSGSDWELFDCDTTKHEGRQSAKMVCMSDAEDHNCGTIWKGQVERTIIEMPSGCGVGK